CYSLASVYMFCKISETMFVRVVSDFRSKTVEPDHRSLVSVDQHLRQFVSLCQMTHNINQFIYIMYVAFIVCTLPNVANQYLNSIYDGNLFGYYRISFFFYMVLMLFFLVALSHA